MTPAAMPMCAEHAESERERNRRLMPYPTERWDWYRDLFGDGVRCPMAKENGHEIITPAYTAEQDRAEAARIERANHFAEQERQIAAWYEREGKVRPVFMMV